MRVDWLSAQLNIDLGNEDRYRFAEIELFVGGGKGIVDPLHTVNYVVINLSKKKVFPSQRTRVHAKLSILGSRIKKKKKTQGGNTRCE